MFGCALIRALYLFVLFCSSISHVLRSNCSDVCLSEVVNQTLTHYPTVDVFYLFLSSGRHMAYIEHGYFWILPYIAKRLSRKVSSTSKFDHSGGAGGHRNHSDTRIHIVSNDDVILKKSKEQGYFSYHIQNYEKYDEFILSQIRASLKGTVSPYEYEVTIYRWLVYCQIMKEWNQQHSHSPMTRILVLDGDVMLSVNAAQFFNNVLVAFTFPSNPLQPHIRPKEHDDRHYDVITMALGVCNLFSPHGLIAFNDFLYNWFNGSTNEVVQRSKEIGSKYFSDMELVKAFINLNTSTRLTCFVFQDHICYSNYCKCLTEYSLFEYLPKMANNHQNVHLIVNHYNQSIEEDEHWLHTTPTSFSQGVSSSYPSVSSYPLLGVQGATSQFPLCFLHFQGNSKKNQMFAYGRAFENLINLHEYGKLLPWDNSFAHRDLLIQPLHSRAVYVLNSTDGKKYMINSMTDLEMRNYSIHTIIPHLPSWLLNAFPNGGTMDPHAPAILYNND